jgi:hypothetical protein
LSSTLGAGGGEGSGGGGHIVLAAINPRNETIETDMRDKDGNCLRLFSESPLWTVDCVFVCGAVRQKQKADFAALPGGLGFTWITSEYR